MVKTGFEKDLEVLLNRYSKESDSNTPDFILAAYIMKCLEAFNSTVVAREVWYGSMDKLGERLSD